MPEIWYATAQFRLDAARRNRLALPLDASCDDMGQVEFYYLDVEGMAVSLTRYSGEPEGIYTLQLDAPNVAKKTGKKISALTRSVLATLGIPDTDITWINTDLDPLFHRVRRRHPSLALPATPD